MEHHISDWYLRVYVCVYMRERDKEIKMETEGTTKAWIFYASNSCAYNFEKSKKLANKWTNTR